MIEATDNLLPKFFDVSKLTESELADLIERLKSEKMERAFSSIRQALVTLGVKNVDAVIDAVMETMELPM